MTHLRGPHIVAVRQRILLEQWIDRVEAHTDLKVGDPGHPKPGDEVFILTYQGAITRSATILKALGVPEFGSRWVDEVQHFPGDYVSKMAFIPAKYSGGLTASPWREDGRESYIYALSGRPIGMSWTEFKEMGTIRTPDCHVWIVKDEAAKMRQLELLVRPGIKTVIYTDYIDPGKAIAKKFDCDFRYGATTDNYAKVKEALATKGLVVVSRIGDEGMSLPELECVIEFTFNKGSRMQSMQRFGRLLHSTEESVVHHVIMPIDEYGRDKKRLYSIYEKGFKIRLHREGVSEKMVEKAEAGPRPRRQRAAARPLTPTPPEVAAQFPPQIADSPGAQKVWLRVNKQTRALFALMLGKDGAWFARSSLWKALGYATPKGFDPRRIDIGYLVSSTWVETKKDGTELYYRTNLRGQKD